MGDNAVIVEGVESGESKEALYSTVHGAGRVMSRTEAKGKYKQKKDRDTGKHYLQLKKERKSYSRDDE